MIKGTEVSKKSGYYVVTDRWQKVTEESVSQELLDELSEYCDEFLIHAVDDSNLFLTKNISSRR